jgi:hypothetical protein
VLHYIIQQRYDDLEKNNSHDEWRRCKIINFLPTSSSNTIPLSEKEKSQISICKHHFAQWYNNNESNM